MIALGITFLSLYFHTLELLETSIYVIMIPLVVSSVTYSTVISSLLTSNVPTKDQGLVLGIGMSVNSLVKIVTPSISSYLIYYFDWQFGVGLVGFIFYSLALTIQLIL